MPIDFNLPELGENIAAGDVLRVLVKPGDTLTKDQPVLELETDKATIEVPSSVAGQVKEVKVKAGEKVKVGQVIFSVEEGAGEGAKPAEKGGAKTAAASDGGDAAKPQPEGAPEEGGMSQAATPERGESEGGQAEARQDREGGRTG